MYDNFVILMYFYNYFVYVYWFNLLIIITIHQLLMTSLINVTWQIFVWENYVYISIKSTNGVPTIRNENSDSEIGFLRY